MASPRAVFTAEESTQHPPEGTAKGTAEGTPSDLSLSGRDQGDCASRQFLPLLCSPTGMPTLRLRPARPRDIAASVCVSFRIYDGESY